ncbi:tripartite tricarboxylate transporter TctB family protein [Micromonospora sp. NPDC050200]|uniref:tripartite tricarboxylate transporter TctB family protein n=1 Tax=Micromonospora sp. NPDC050200 TaxID=3155664 RepID=UPI0033F41B84
MSGTGAHVAANGVPAQANGVPPEADGVPPEVERPATEPPGEELPPGGPVLATVAGVVPVLTGLVAFWLARGLGLGTLTDPGPGLWPTIVAVLLVVSGAAIVARARRTTDTEAFTRGTGVVLVGAASLALYAFLFELVGFEIPTVLVLVLWLRFFGRESWRTTALVSLLTTAALYALFITALGVPLPHLIVI